MENLWIVIGLALLPGLGNLAGGMVAEYLPTSPRLLNLALHAASGIVIGVVAIELMPEALSNLAGWWIATAFAAGGTAYVGADKPHQAHEADGQRKRRQRDVDDLRRRGRRSDR
ncbi:hypothetical protein ACSQ8B_07075 [Marinovum sp. F03]|uniref:hypothetical protein n=1 Tax=Marinovum sp. F03 TaxID=3449226 RepID=UPI003EDC90D4